MVGKRILDILEMKEYKEFTKEVQDIVDKCGITDAELYMIYIALKNLNNKI